MNLPKPLSQSPQVLVRLALRLLLCLYRLGWGRAMAWLPLLVLTTQCRQSGRARHALIEYRRHGSKYYLVSGWGGDSDWHQNVLQHPRVTMQRGSQVADAIAQPVTNPAEALPALYMFSRNSWVYERLFAHMNSAHAADLSTLTEVVGEFTVVRLEPSGEAPQLPALELYSEPLRQMALLGVLLMGLWLLLGVLRRLFSFGRRG